MAIERPAWKIGENIHSGSRAAKDIDLDASTAEALGEVKYYSRMEEPISVEKAAVEYAATAMEPVLVPLALMARDRGHVAEPGGWEMRVVSHSHCEICLSLTHPGSPGGWCVAMDLTPRYTDDAAARIAELDKIIGEKLADLGLNRREVILRRLGLGATPASDALPEEEHLARIKAAPGSFKPIAADVPLKELRAYDVCLPAGGIGGHGRGGSRPGIEDLGDSSLFLDDEKRAGWNRGLCVKLAPSAMDRDDGLLKPASGRDGVMPHHFMKTLAGLLKANGFENAIRAREAEISSHGWICYGSGNSPALQEIGHGLVHRAGGIWDATVTAGLREFSVEIAACDMGNILDDTVRLARDLDERGHNHPSRRFSANDGRDLAWAESDSDSVTIFNETQSGTYRTDVMLRDGAPSKVLCYRERSGAPYLPVGRFHVDGECNLQQDFMGTVMHDVEIAYNIRNIRDMNGIISSLGSLSCVMDEELESIANDEPQP